MSSAGATIPATPLARFRREPQAVVGLVLVGLMVLAATFAPQLAPLAPDEQYTDGLTATGMPRPPGSVVTIEHDGGQVPRTFLLGSDNLGRDQLSRLIYGARISLAVGLLAMLTAVTIGAAIGLLSGFFRGWVETVLMRATDIMLTIPTLILAIAFVAVMPRQPLVLHLGWFGTHELPRELLNLFLVIGLVSWTGIARVVRSETLRVSTLDYVAAARALGCSRVRVLLRHVLPNVLPTIVVLASLATANTILLDAGLSYLGIGIPPPIPSWGAMINEGQPYLVTAPWMILGPGVCVVVAVLGFNLVGQGLQNALDPHRREA